MWVGKGIFTPLYPTIRVVVHSSYLVSILRCQHSLLKTYCYSTATLRYYYQCIEIYIYKLKTFIIMWVKVFLWPSLKLIAREIDSF